MMARVSGGGVARCMSNVCELKGYAERFRSAGLEEYIEGLSFLHYLETRNLISLREVQDTLSDKETGEQVSLSPNRRSFTT